MSSQTNSSINPIPYSYFVLLQIGSIQLGNMSLVRGENEFTPQTITSFKITRLTEVDGDSEFNGILYESAEFEFSMIARPQLERELIEYMNNSGAEPSVNFKYGYVNGVKSPMYPGIITKLQLSSDMYSLRMTVSYTQPGGSRVNFLPNTLSTITSRKYDKYSKIVSDIAIMQGWNVGTIVDTRSIDQETFIYPDINDTVPSYINKIKGFCVSESGEGAYVSEFKYNDGGVEEYNFRPSSFLISGSNYRISKNFNFVFNMLPNGNVLNFTPVLTDGTGAIGATYVSDSEDASHTNKDSNIFGVVTQDTKEFTTISYDLETSEDNTRDLLNPTGKMIVATKRGIKLSSTYADVENYAESVIKDDISTYAYSVAMNASATMDILGDPDLQLMDYINVIPMYPAQSFGSGGVMHPSGGTYRIRKIVDTVSNGQYITSLELTKENNTLRLSRLSNGSYVEPVPPPEPEPPKPREFTEGDRVYFTGSTHYVSSYPGSKGYGNRKPEWTTITIINHKVIDTPGAHPYHLIHEGEFSKDNNVYGWVDKGDFEFRDG